MGPTVKPPLNVGFLRHVRLVLSHSN
ncbi:hypothetical protein CCACVL1_22464 [Corchorus capsularis]|uniref:Uncharacterized protein n=1 Tax=Corchorus capsularis TaxID=210143 RepID=A0A1R3GYD5_COCAP|nr:hypothetical protein CCACVL1_22464 [Corchorus capsularis]